MSLVDYIVYVGLFSGSYVAMIVTVFISISVDAQISSHLPVPTGILARIIITYLFRGFWEMLFCKLQSHWLMNG